MIIERSICSIVCRSFVPVKANNYEISFMIIKHITILVITINLGWNAVVSGEKPNTHDEQFLFYLKSSSFRKRSIKKLWRSFFKFVLCVYRINGWRNTEFRSRKCLKWKQVLSFFNVWSNLSFHAKISWKFKLNF